MNFKLQRYEERPATIQEHRELRDEIARLREAKRHFSALADAKGKENVAFKAALEYIATFESLGPDTYMDVVHKARDTLRTAEQEVRE